MCLHALMCAHEHSDLLTTGQCPQPENHDKLTRVLESRLVSWLAGVDFDNLFDVLMCQVKKFDFYQLKKHLFLCIRRPRPPFRIG